MRQFIFSILSIILFTQCVEDFDLKFPKSEPRLVVEGLISNNPGPYYVFLTKSKIGEFVTYDNNLLQNAEPIKDALVVISDDFGQVDTLKLIQANDDSGLLDYWYDGGYKTSNLKGISDHTYELKIKVWGKEFYASAYLLPVPEIDSLRFERKTSEKDGSQYYVPLLNFKEPQNIENYYLVQLKDENNPFRRMNTSIWQYSIFSDTYLKPYVSNLNIYTGTNPRGITHLVYQEGDSIYLSLSSLTKEAYNYYKSLLDQFENDGGAYKPTPTSPPGNISNGGLGLFRASSFSEKRIKIPRVSNITSMPMK